MLNSDQEDSDSSESNLNPVGHKISLMKLKDTDPEFFKYLKENDKNLLDFNLSDNEDDSSVKDFDNRHIPNEELEVLDLYKFYIHVYTLYLFFHNFVKYLGC